MGRNGTLSALGRSGRLFAQTLAWLVVVASLVAAGVAVRLAQGPVSLKPLVPLLARALESAAPGIEVEIADSTLRWEGWQRGIDLRLIDVRVKGPDQEPIVQVNELQVGLSPLSLIERKLLIEEIEILNTRVRLIRSADGRFQLSLAGVEGTTAEGALLGGLLAPERDPAMPLSYLNRLRLTAARLDVIDSDGELLLAARVPTAGLRRASGGLAVDAVVIAAEGGETGELDLRGTFQPASGLLDLQAELSALNPAGFAATAAVLQPLAALDLPLRGTARLSVSSAGAVQSVHLKLTAGAGRLVLTEALAQALGQPLVAQTIAVKGGALAASARFADQVFEVSDFALDFVDGSAIHLPPPVDHPYPLRRLKARARGTAEHVVVELLDLDLAGPKISGTLDANRRATPLTAQVKLVAEGLPVDDFRRYWPPRLAPGGYKWCVEHLSEGRVERAELMAAIAQATGGLAVQSLSGTFHAKNVTVAYLPPLPAVRAVDGAARFNHNSLTIELASGTSLGLTIPGGTIALTDLEKPVEQIAIDILLDGPFRDVLDLISRPPLRYTERVGISPEQASGHARARVQLQFPLLNNLPMERIAVDVNGQVSGGVVERAVGGLSVTNGNLSVSVDDNGLAMNGTLAVDGIPASLDWREDFRASAAVKSRLRLITERFAVAKLAPLLPPEAELATILPDGDIASRIDLAVRKDGTQRIAVEADLTAAEVALAPAGWRKPPGTPANCTFEAILVKDRLVRVPSARCRGEGLDVGGRADFDKAGAVRQIELDRFEVGRNSATATAIRLDDGGWDIRAGGRSLDVEPLLRRTDAAKRDSSAKTPPPHLSVAVDVDAAWFSSSGRLDAVQLTATREKGLWSPVRATATVAAGAPVTLSLSPDPAGQRRLTLEAENAGATLSALGLFGDMRGGRLSLSGRFADGEPDRPLSGRLKVRDYQIVNAPLLARLLNIMALTGIADALRGEGISFSTLDAPFTWRNGTLQLTDAKAHGTSLGLTASGTVDVEAERVDVKGTIVPFYVINSALGRLPLIGELFTGGEAGGGVFAATYALSGPLTEPQIWINPLSIFGPGVLRHLFAVFDLLAPGESASPQAPPP